MIRGFLRGNLLREGDGGFIGWVLGVAACFMVGLEGGLKCVWIST